MSTYNSQLAELLTFFRLNNSVNSEFKLSKKIINSHHYDSMRINIITSKYRAFITYLRPTDSSAISLLQYCEITEEYNGVTTRYYNRTIAECLSALERL